MPTLMLRDLPAALRDRLRAYARRQELSTTDAAVALIDYGLDMHAARAAGAAAVNGRRTPEERSAAARHAALSRHRREG